LKIIIFFFLVCRKNGREYQHGSILPQNLKTPCKEEYVLSFRSSYSFVDLSSLDSFYFIISIRGSTIKRAKFQKYINKHGSRNKMMLCYRYCIQWKLNFFYDLGFAILVLSQPETWIIV